MTTLRTALESPLEASVVRAALAKYGLRSIKLKLSLDAHWPDRLFIFPGGGVFWIEFKAPGGVVSPGQEHRINWLISLGHDVEVHDTYDGALASLRDRLQLCTSSSL